MQMYEKMHILSPLVAPREFFLIRYCRQLNASTWVMVDVSYDFIKQLQDAAPTRSWKLPSGCMIEDISNGKSNVSSITPLIFSLLFLWGGGRITLWDNMDAFSVCASIFPIFIFLLYLNSNFRSLV